MGKSVLIKKFMIKEFKVDNYSVVYKLIEICKTYCIKLLNERFEELTPLELINVNNG